LVEGSQRHLEERLSPSHFLSRWRTGRRTDPGDLGEGDQTREIGGAENVYFPGRAHTEVTTSRRAFLQVYEFLLGEEPETGNVTAENPKRVKVAGRSTSFPSNVGNEGALLNVYEVRAATGTRKTGEPVYSKTLGADGSVGPFKSTVAATTRLR
jgi:hypothetical protein